MQIQADAYRRASAGLIIFIVTVAECQRVTQPPLDVAAVLGSSLRLPCRMGTTGDYLEWLEYITDISGKRIFLSFMNNADKEIAQSHPRRRRYRIAGNYDLEVRNVSWDDAGRYRCRLMLSGRHQDTDVIVLDKIQCNGDVTVEEGKRTLLTCGIRYNASAMSKKVPQLRWFQDKTKLSGSLVFGDNYVKHSLNLYPYASDDHTTYTCSALFDNPPPYHQQRCTVKLSVLYAPRIVKVTPKRMIYAPGQQVACTAEGNPQPSFTWDRIHGNGPVRITGNILVISHSMAGNNTYRCTARNIIHSTNRGDSIDITFTVLVPPTTPPVYVNSRAGRTQQESVRGGVSRTLHSSRLLTILLLLELLFHLGDHVS